MFEWNPWKQSFSLNHFFSQVILLFLPWIILILRGAQTLAVIWSSSASTRALNKPSVAWISFCGCMGHIGELWGWRASLHWPLSECLVTARLPHSERTTHLGLRGDLEPPCLFCPLAPFWKPFAIHLIGSVFVIHYSLCIVSQGWNTG